MLRQWHEVLQLLAVVRILVLAVLEVRMLRVAVLELQLERRVLSVLRVTVPQLDVMVGVCLACAVLLELARRVVVVVVAVLVLLLKIAVLAIVLLLSLLLALLTAVVVRCLRWVVVVLPTPLVVVGDLLRDLCRHRRGVPWALVWALERAATLPRHFCTTVPWAVVLLAPQLGARRSWGGGHRWHDRLQRVGCHAGRLPDPGGVQRRGERLGSGAEQICFRQANVRVRVRLGTQGILGQYIQHHTTHTAHESRQGYWRF